MDRSDNLDYDDDDFWEHELKEAKYDDAMMLVRGFLWAAALFALVLIINKCAGLL